MPAQSTDGSLGATASAPIDERPIWSEIGSQFEPASVVRQTPPSAVPA